MIRSAPPLANWLIRRFVSSRHREALLGDLAELFAAGRSRSWYWRQALTAVFRPRWNLSWPLSVAFKTVLLALGLIIMGAGTLSWATTLEQDGSATTCRP